MIAITSSWELLGSMQTIEETYRAWTCWIL